MQQVAHEETAAGQVPSTLARAQELLQLGRFEESRNQPAAAEQAYRQALELHASSLEAWLCLGLMLERLGRTAEAEECQIQALRLEPERLLGVLRGAALQNPRSAQAHHNLGIALLQLHRREAPIHFIAALKIDPDFFEAAEALGRSLLEAGLFNDAIEAFREARRIRPRSVDIRLRLANACMIARQLHAARAEYEELLREQPGLAAAQAGLATVYVELGQFTKPRALLERALSERPDDHWARIQYAWLLLRHGDFGSGWDFYESRWAALPTKAAFERGFTQPRWQGESLAGRTLLVTREQAFGDEILFASVIPDVLREAAHCVIECDRRLEGLYRRSFPTATVLAVDSKSSDWDRVLPDRLPQLPSIDCWSPIGSLPRFRRRGPADFPRHDGYLRADEAHAEHWRERLREIGDGLKVGISWRGGTAVSRAALRSVTLEQLAPVLGLRGTRFVSLQYGDQAEELRSFAAAHGTAIQHWPEALADYDETAALVAGLDLVISVCTAVVNLAGALHRPTWVMAPLVPDARYGWQGETMIWYPSVRVFRQEKLDTWAPVITRVRRNLQELLRAETGHDF